MYIVFIDMYYTWIKFGQISQKTYNCVIWRYLFDLTAVYDVMIRFLPGTCAQTPAARLQKPHLTHTKHVPPYLQTR